MCVIYIYMCIYIVLLSQIPLAWDHFMTCHQNLAWLGQDELDNCATGWLFTGSLYEAMGRMDS